MKQGTIPPPPRSAAPRSAASSDLWCLVVFGPGSTDRILLEPNSELTIGRGERAEILIDHPTISREHALFINRGPVPRLKDLGSRNGTRLNGKQLQSKEEVPLEDGARIEIGPATIVAHLERTSRGRFTVGVRRDPPSDAAPRTKASGITASRTIGAGQMLIADAAMHEVLRRAELAAATPLPVLIFGETGVGKEHIADVLHAHSTRSNRQLVRVNCAALTPTLIEAELFGHERGAFTGADQTKHGLVEIADGGSLFLDEIGDLPLGAQAKLLRLLEVGEYMRVGSTKARTTNVRFISATHRDLRDLVLRGEFRADFYHRINGVTIRVPPLRERPKDIPLLIRHFAERALQGRGPVPVFEEAAIERLAAFQWPGNVRQLRRFIERWILMTRLEVVTVPDVLSWLAQDNMSAIGDTEESPERHDWDVETTVESRILLDRPPHVSDVPSDRSPPPPGPATVTDPDNLEAQLRDLRAQKERERIVGALASTGGNQAEAALILGISRRTLINRLNSLKIPRPRKRT